MPRYPFSDHRSFSSVHGSDIRPALLRELTDLYVQKPSHTPEETRLFTELALRLIDHVDAAERVRLGARLAAYPGAPLAVIQRLAKPDGASTSAPPETSVDIPAQYLPRIETSRHDETLSEIFFNALPAERRLILLHLDHAPIAPASFQMTTEAVVRIERAAMSRQPDALTAALGQALSISLACARRIAGDSTGEAVIAAFKALAMPPPTLQRILLFLNPAIGHSSDMYFALVRLYDEIGESAARRLIAIWRRDDPPALRKGEYRAELFEDDNAHARDFARHDGRPVTENMTLSETRRKSQTEI